MAKDKKEKEDDPRFFYAVVLITIGIAGLLIWQIFFVETPLVLEPDPAFKDFPRFEFTFLDSLYYQELDGFQRGDDPMLAWEKIRADNPFEEPTLPRQRDIRDWWGVYALTFRIEEGLILETPPIEEVDPELVLFEDRWYKVEWYGSEECAFVLENDQGEEMEVKRNEEKTITFRADREMDAYSCREEPDVGGDIVFATEIMRPAPLSVIDQQTGLEEVDSFLGEFSATYDEFYDRRTHIGFEEMREINKVFERLDQELYQLVSEWQREAIRERDIIEEVNEIERRFDYEINRFREHLRADFEAEPEEPEQETEEPEEPQEPDEEDPEPETEMHPEIIERRENLEELFGYVEVYEEQVESEIFEEAMELVISVEEDLQEIENSYNEEELEEEELTNQLEEFDLKANEVVDQVGEIFENN